MSTVTLEAKETEKFQLLRSSHFHPTGKLDEQARPVMRQYRQGEIIDTNIDLCDMYNPKDRNGKQIRGDEKFIRVNEAPPTIVNDTAQRSDESLSEWAQRLGELAKNANVLAIEQTKKQDTMLDSMNINELKALAEEEEIDLKGQTKKEEMVKTIRAIRSASK